MKFIYVAISCCFLFVSANAFAGLYQCVNDSGETIFTDLPCQKGDTQKTVNVEFDERGLRSYFFKYPGVSSSPTCSQQTCQCGNYIHTLKGEPITDLTMVALNLEQAWQQYETSKKSNFSTSRVSCRIKVHQKLFNRLYPLVLKKQVAIYRMDRFLGHQSTNKCGQEPNIDTSGWISDRAYIDWYECTDKYEKKTDVVSNREMKKKLKRLQYRLDQLK